MKTLQSVCALLCLSLMATAARADGMTTAQQSATYVPTSHCHVTGYGAGSFVTDTVAVGGISAPLGAQNLGAGLGLGCDYIAGRFLAGVLADYTWNRGNADVTAGGVTVLGAPLGNEWSVGARVGVFPTTSTLLYGLVAYTGAQDKNASMMGVPLNLSGPKGVAIGGGIEAAIAKNVTLSLEYRHVAFDTTTATAIPVKFDTTENVARVGVSYHFGSVQ
jgi:opacity protein-like surface antigen